MAEDTARRIRRLLETAFTRRHNGILKSVIYEETPDRYTVSWSELRGGLPPKRQDFEVTFVTLSAAYLRDVTDEQLTTNMLATMTEVSE
jgi:hypothetical protein